MLIAEYDYDVDIAVQREEEREIALKEGIAQGEAKGAYQKALETAKNLLGLGLSVANIAHATGNRSAAALLPLRTPRATLCVL